MSSSKLSVLSLILAIVGLCCSSISLAYRLASADAQKGRAEGDKAIQYVMYVGANDKDTYRPEHSQEEARDIVDRVCLKYFDGYTLQDATGAWTDETGEITHEYTLVCYFDGADGETVYRAADEIIEALNQNTVLIEKDEIDMEYYGGR